jgi:sugar/nucleoside kinase (ribokinase family)
MASSKSRAKPAPASAAAPLDVLTVGAATRDIFVRSSAFARMTDPDAPDGFNVCFPMGAKLPAEEILSATGGGATNAAVTFARLGFRTACLCRIGTDAAGEDVRKDLEREQVSTDLVQSDRTHATGQSVIFLAGTGERAIFTSRGASRELEVPAGLPAARAIYLTSLGGLTAHRERLSDLATASGALFAWNPGQAEIDDGLHALHHFLSRIDVLILNREEAAALAQVSPRFLDRILRILGPVPRRALVVTDGASGAYAVSGGATWHAGQIDAPRINATGAGDAFGSGFVASLLAHPDDIPRALQTAGLNGYGVVTHMGAKAGILKREPNATERLLIPIRQLRAASA